MTRGGYKNIIAGVHISVMVCTQFESANGVRKEGSSLNVPQKTLNRTGDLQMPTHLILAVYKSDRGNSGKYLDKGG